VKKIVGKVWREQFEGEILEGIFWNEILGIFFFFFGGGGIFWGKFLEGNIFFFGGGAD
jgi:hypothetical protein